MNTLQFFSRVVMLAGLILITAACVQTSLPQASQTPTPVPATLQPTPFPTLWGGASAELGLVPQICPPGPVPKDISITIAIGASPVWVAGFVGPHAMLVWTPEQALAFHHSDGWGHKNLWVVEDSVKGLVTIHGANLRDGSPLRPDADGAAATSTPTSLVLDPHDPHLTNRAGHLAEFPGGLTIPEAGCYVLEADWPGGFWRITFAAGEVLSSS